MTAPDDRLYSRDHVWVQAGDDGHATLGLTDYAQGELGEVVYVELPPTGDVLTAGDTFGVVESVKVVSDLVAPVNGEVLERHDALAERPELLNESPYDGAWLLRVRLSDPAELDSLLDAASYEALAGD